MIFIGVVWLRRCTILSSAKHGHAKKQKTRREVALIPLFSAESASNWRVSRKVSAISLPLMTAPVASGQSDGRVRLVPAEKRHFAFAHANFNRFASGLLRYPDASISKREIT